MSESVDPAEGTRPAEITLAVEGTLPAMSRMECGDALWPGSMPGVHADLLATASDALPRLEPGDAVDQGLAKNPRYLVRRLFSATGQMERQVMIYLPEAYAAEPDRRFPVFYLHDGQNVFDGETSYLPGHTWRAHEAADRLTATGAMEPLILVGIANAGMQRMLEYTPTADVTLGGGGGDEYGRLLIEELKPLIDAGWRTRPGPNDTGLGGSSLGGLISLHLALTHRDIFGRVAVISPSLWWDRRSIFALVRQAKPLPELRVWLDMGTAEGARHLHDADQLFGLLLERGWEDGREVVYQRVLGGVHHEDAWASRFGDVLSFLFPGAPRTDEVWAGVAPMPSPPGGLPQE